MGCHAHASLELYVLPNGEAFQIQDTCTDFSKSHEQTSGAGGDRTPDLMSCGDNAPS